MTHQPTTSGPDGRLQAWLFDLDGVITDTAKVHAEAWKEMFDDFLAGWSSRTGQDQAPFTAADYQASVDGRLRHDGVRTFLASRGIELAEGVVDDAPGSQTVHGLANAKNGMFLEVLARDGVEVYPSTVDWVKAVRAAGCRCGVVSASRNCEQVLAVAGLDGLFEVRVDGVVAARDGLRGKPAPDTFVAAAHRLGVTPDRCAVVEDALSGVRAARDGGFGWVVGVDRVGQADALRSQGADVVVADLIELMEGN